MSIAREGNPPPGAPLPVSLVVVPMEGTITVRFIDVPSGMMTHYKKVSGGKGVPLHCPGSQACDKAAHRLPLLWKAYACVEVWREAPYRDWLPAVLEITQRLYECLKGEDLRGQLWELWRVIGTTGLVEATGKTIGKHAPDQLREPFSMRAVLSRIYKTTDLKMGVPCPVPDRVFLAPSIGEAPPTAKDERARSDEMDRREANRIWHDLREKSKNNGTHKGS